MTNGQGGNTKPLHFKNSAEGSLVMCVWGKKVRVCTSELMRRDTQRVKIQRFFFRFSNDKTKKLSTFVQLPTTARKLVWSITWRDTENVYEFSGMIKLNT